MGASNGAWGKDLCVKNTMAGPGNPRKKWVLFLGACFWMAERLVSDQAPQRSNVSTPCEGPQIGLEKWHQALGGKIRSTLRLFGACFVCALLVVGCCDYWVLFFALLLSFFVLQMHGFCGLLARVFPPNSGVIMLPTQTSCIFFQGKSFKFTIHSLCFIPPLK